MTSNQDLLSTYRQYMLPVLDFRNIVIEKASGSYVWDCDGKQYLDLNSGQFCSVFGHSDPLVAETITNVSKKIQDTDTSTLSQDVLYAAKKIHDISPEMNSRVLFLSTGAEANECCLKYAKHLKEKDGIIAFDQGYHGLTHGTAAYSMSRDRIRPPLENSFSVPVPRIYSDNQINEVELESSINEFKSVAEKNSDKIAAAIFEPIVSGGGLYFPPKRYFQRIRQICDDNDIFLIFDECQTGFGRTGSWFYYQQLECTPDFVVAAKAVGLGYPVACVIANGNTVNNDRFLMQHFSSHQNEPFAGALVSFGIDRLREENRLQNNKVIGDYLLSSLQALSKKHQSITSARGKGLMCGFDLSFDQVSNIQEQKQMGEAFCIQALENGMLIQHCNNGKTIRLLPNYLVTRKEIDECIDLLETTLQQFKQTPYQYKFA